MIHHALAPALARDDRRLTARLPIRCLVRAALPLPPATALSRRQARPPPSAPSALAVPPISLTLGAAPMASPCRPRTLLPRRV